MWVFTITDLIDLVAYALCFACIIVPIIAILRSVLLKDKPAPKRKR